MKPEIKEALEIIRQACATVVADWKSHVSLQNAIKKIEDELSPQSVEDNNHC